MEQVLPKIAGPSHYSGFDQMPIAGRWRNGNGTKAIRDTDPYTGDVLVEIRQADPTDLDAAYVGALKVQRDWGSALPAERATVMRRVAEIMTARKEEIVSWLIRESGSTRIKANIEHESSTEVMLEAATLTYIADGRILPADVPGKESRVYRKPVGVVGVITPWNWPLHLTLRSVAPALAVGNTVVIKPASDTPVTGGLLPARIFEEAGLPPGALSVIAGSGEEIGETFITHPVPRVISFTGSTQVGRSMARLAGASPILKRVELELGGNAPFVVLRDADLDEAVRAGVFGKFFHQGQICMAVNRFILDEPIHDAFLERFTERTRRLPVGDPNKPDTVIGPLINNSQLQRLLTRVRSALDAGVRQVLGGEPKGLVLPPIVLAGVTNEMPVAREELFGPVAPFIRARDADEALSMSNDTEYGFAGSVFTRDHERGALFARRLETGMAHVNDQPVNDLRFNPFGGEKNSGVGRFNGTWAIEAFTTHQWVTLQHTPRPLPF